MLVERMASSSARSSSSSSLPQAFGGEILCLDHCETSRSGMPLHSSTLPPRHANENARPASPEAHCCPPPPPRFRESEAQLREDIEVPGLPSLDTRLHRAQRPLSISAPEGAPEDMDSRASDRDRVDPGRPSSSSLRRHTGDFWRPSAVPPRPSLNTNCVNSFDFNNSGSLSPWAKQTILCRTVSGSIMQCAAVSLPSPSSSCSTSSSSSFSIADFRDLAKEVQDAFPNSSSGYASESEALKALNRLSRTSTANGREGPIRIMVAVDESEECREALDWALANVIKGHRVLCLVHVLAPIPFDDSAPAMDNMYVDLPWLLEEEIRLAREQKIEERQKERRIKASKMLHALKDQITVEHQLDVEIYVLEGEVVPLLVQTVEKLHPEKLIMGRYRRSGFQRVVGGNGVSDQCIKLVKNWKETMVLAIRRKKAGGYSITSRVKKDFWLLA